MVSLQSVLKIIERDTVSSTMTEALEAAAASKALPFWILANQQTQGRGRRGKTWQSPKGNFYGTLVFALNTNIPRQFYGLLFGVAVHKALLKSAPSLSGKLHLKWPNDILFDGAKLAGLLAEIHGNKVLFGLGVNLVPMIDVDAYGSSATSLGQMGAEIDRAVFCADICVELNNLIVLVAEQGTKLLFKQWNACALPKNTALNVHCADGRTLKGLFQGLDTQGQLQLQCEAGLVSVAAADITFQH